jgi:hypothetical protein
MKSGSIEKTSFRPPLVRSLLFGFGMGFAIAIALATVMELTPLLQLIVICVVAIQLLRIELVMFDASENSPWYVRATCSFLGFPILSRNPSPGRDYGRPKIRGVRDDTLRHCVWGKILEGGRGFKRPEFFLPL